jgi:hypothetical protein
MGFACTHEASKVGLSNTESKRNGKAESTEHPLGTNSLAFADKCLGELGLAGVGAFIWNSGVSTLNTNSEAFADSVDANFAPPPKTNSGASADSADMGLAVSISESCQASEMFAQV